MGEEPVAAVLDEDLLHPHNESSAIKNTALSLSMMNSF